MNKKNKYYLATMKANFIHISDLATVLDPTTLLQLTGGDTGQLTEVLNNVQPAQLEVVAGYIRHYYNTDEEMRGVKIFSTFDHYKAGDRILDNNTHYLCVKDTEQKSEICDLSHFQPEDDRNAVLVELVANLCVYAIFRRITPRVVPEQQQVNYDNAIATLKDIQRGRVQLTLKPKEETVAPDYAGNNVAWGGFESFPNTDY